MNDLLLIEKNYRTMPVDELQHIANKPEVLRIDVIPILQKVLIDRGLQEEAISLTEFLIKQNEEPRFSKLSKNEIKELINERIDSGESLDSIKIDLKDGGIDILDIIEDDNSLREKAFNYISLLKREGFEDKEIDEKLKEKYSLNEEQSKTIKTELKKSGKTNLIFGYSIALISIIIIITSLSIGGSVTISGVIIFSIGIWRILKGYEQMRN